jgi:nucleotidyltransferase AbiEii toxin of type IV toxin-antitoxin system
VAKASLTKLAATLEDVVAVLPAGRAFAVVGGLAVSTRTEPRFTRDIDFAIAVESEEDAQQVVYGMQRAGFFVEAIIEHRTSRRMATARLRQGPKSPMVDLLFAASGIEAEVASSATREAVLGQPVPVACVGHLIAMKLVSFDEKRRPQDQLDLTALSQVADDAEWARAEAAVRLITERGFGRDRDLKAALEEWREQARVIRSGP